MAHRFIAWSTEDGIFRGHKLLAEEQIVSIITELMKQPRQQEVFATIQEYNEAGEAMCCPIYADFDGLSSLKDTRDFVCKIENELGIVPKIYFSGNKGFHVIIPYQVKGTRCHIAVQKLLAKFGQWISLDAQVYTSRRLLRLNNSYHFKGKLFKVAITQEELNILDMPEIRMIATEQRQLNSDMIIIPKDKLDMLDHIMTDIYKEIDTVATTKKTSLPDSGEWSEAITPCIRSLIENRPDDGYMNSTLVTIAKFFKFYSVNEDECISILMSYHHYNSREESSHDVLKVVHSIYRSCQYYKPNCRYGSDGVVMKRYCDKLCQYNEEDLW